MRTGTFRYLPRFSLSFIKTRETDDVEMFTQRFFSDGNAFLQNQGRFAEGQCIAFDGVGIIRRFNDKFFSQPLQFYLAQGTQLVKCIFQGINFHKEGIHSETPFESFLVSNFTMMSRKKQQIPLKRAKLLIRNHL